MTDDLEQQVGAGFVDGEMAEFVEDQQPWSEVAAQEEACVRIQRACASLSG